MIASAPLFGSGLTKDGRPRYQLLIPVVHQAVQIAARFTRANGLCDRRRIHSQLKLGPPAVAWPLVKKTSTRRPATRILLIGALHWKADEERQAMPACLAGYPVCNALPGMSAIAIGNQTVQLNDDLGNAF